VVLLLQCLQQRNLSPFIIMTSSAGVEGLTRRLIPLTSIGWDDDLERRPSWQEEDSTNDSDEENYLDRYRKRPFNSCGKRIGWLCGGRFYGMPLSCITRRGDEKKGIDNHKVFCQRLKWCCCSRNTYFYWGPDDQRVMRNSNPTSLCTWYCSAALRILREYAHLTWGNGSSTVHHSVALSSSFRSAEPLNPSIMERNHPFDDATMVFDTTRSTITEKFPPGIPSPSKVEGIKTQRISYASVGTGEINCQNHSSQSTNEHDQSSKQTKSPPTGTTTDATLEFDNEHVLVDYSQSRVDKLPDRPDLEVLFTPLPSENNTEFPLFNCHILPDESTNEDVLCFYIRFPDAESIQRRKIDQKQRAERTADFLENAKSMSLQLNSRGGSLMTTSYGGSSIDSGYDTSAGPSTPRTDIDRGRRHQRRGSFLAGSKIERFDNSRSSSRKKCGSYVRYNATKGDYYREDVNQRRRNSLVSQETESRPEEENYELQNLQRMRMELGYEDVEVPLKCDSKYDIHVQDRKQQAHAYHDKTEIAKHLKRPRTRRGPRRSSFVAGSKIELFGGGRKSSRKCSNLRASM
jgi:hypothetical protein